MLNTLPLAIDPALDPAPLRPIFERSGRLHIPGFLRPDDAGRVYHALAQETRWQRALRHGDTPYLLDPGAFERLAPGERDRIGRAVLEQAAGGFGYAFDSWAMSDFIEAGQRGGGPLEAVYDLLNSQPFLGFVRAMTGERRAVYVDGQATRYRPGDFLNHHNDDTDGPHRLFAYVLNLTPRWRVDWGGLLLFLDPDGHVAEGYTPAFNALNIFRVPADHAVSMVAPFAGAPRLSITGWVRSEGPGAR